MQVHRVIYPVLDRDLARIDSFSYTDQAFREHAEIPIEGVGVVHVITEVSDADPRYGFSDVTLARYRDGELAAPTPLAGSVCESSVARCMHEHWCDPKRLIRCVRGDSKTRYVLDIDWEIDDDDIDGPDPSSGEDCPDPGLTPRILAIAELTKTRPVGTVPLGSDGS